MESKMAKRRKLSPGDVFEINLGVLGHAYGVLATGNDVAFYDMLSPSTLSLDMLEVQKILFRVYVVEDGLLSGQWKIIGSISLTGDLLKPCKYRNQPVGSNDLFVYQAQKFTPATYDEVKDLEPLVVWFPMHIEERLRDHFEGRPNKAFELMSRIKKYDPTTRQEIPMS
jgi:hypothetical protein